MYKWIMDHWWTDEWMGKCMNLQMDEHRDGRMDGKVNVWVCE